MAGNANSGRRPGLETALGDLRSEHTCLAMTLEEAAKSHNEQARSLAAAWKQYEQFGHAIRALEHRLAAAA